MAAMFFLFSNGSVLDLLLPIGRRKKSTKSRQRKTPTNLTRSKTATRFPTGLSKLLPSGVKRTLPCL